MKRRFLARNWSCVLLILWLSGLGVARPDEATDPLDRQIPGGWAFQSFDDALRQIEQKTGFKVVCPEELDAFMQTIWMKESFTGTGNPAVGVRFYLDQYCETLSLKWQFDPKTGTVSVAPAWKVADPRTPAELLKAVWQPGGTVNYEKDPQWQNAFNALLSHAGNFDKAWKVRQKSAFQGIFFKRPSKPILMQEVIGTDGMKYVLIVISQPMQMSPGHGSVSYYWFGDDGVLAGADLMNTGHRCTLVNMTVGNQHGQNAGNASEIQMSLAFNEHDFYLARFVLAKQCLRLNRLTNEQGEAAAFNGIGKSLMGPDQP